MVHLAKGTDARGDSPIKLRKHHLKGEINWIEALK